MSQKEPKFRAGDIGTSNLTHQHIRYFIKSNYKYYEYDIYNSSNIYNSSRRFLEKFGYYQIQEVDSFGPIYTDVFHEPVMGEIFRQIE